MMYQSIDGLRGWGCMLVMLYHFGLPCLQSAWLLMSIFFVLSGFVITLSTLDVLEKNGEISITQFWSRRVARLFPALLVFILIAAVQPYLASWFFNKEFPDDVHVKLLREDLLTGLFYFLNWD